MKNIFGQRLGAFAIDYLVIWVATISVFSILGEPMPNGGRRLDGLPAFLPPAFWTLWLVIPEWLWGASLGKAMVGIRVRRVDGSRLGFGGALLRRICDPFDFWMSFGLVATICHFKTPRHQRLGDLAAGAVVTIKKLDFEDPPPPVIDRPAN